MRHAKSPLRRSVGIAICRDSIWMGVASYYSQKSGPWPSMGVPELTGTLFPSCFESFPGVSRVSWLLRPLSLSVWRFDAREAGNRREAVIDGKRLDEIRRVAINYRPPCGTHVTVRPRHKAYACRNVLHNSFASRSCASPVLHHPYVIRIPWRTKDTRIVIR